MISSAHDDSVLPSVLLGVKPAVTTMRFYSAAATIPSVPLQEGSPCPQLSIPRWGLRASAGGASPSLQLCISGLSAPPSSSALRDFLDAIHTTVAPILATPRRGRVTLPLSFTPQRSACIAKADRGLDAETKGRRVPLRRLGLLTDDEPISDAMMAKYYKLFEGPIAAEIIVAFADFYG
ncbi:hypothetical protein D1007_36593 [Hordeum vulgare]|nr:hypothetical protein D1007_36593 [Hordeum vulgare]